MSTAAPLLRICHFDSPFVPPKPYFCYSKEVCCREGCCVDYTDYKYFQTWYFWLGVIIAFVLYRYMCWYCKKKDRRNRAALQNPPTSLSDDNLSPHVVNLMVSYNNYPIATTPKDDDTDDPPPLYSVAVHLPKPDNIDEIPTYEQATTMK